MSRHDILWNLDLAEGQEYQAAWWMYHREEYHAHPIGVTHGVPVLRATREKVRDFIG